MSVFADHTKRNISMPSSLQTAHFFARFHTPSEQIRKEYFNAELG
ncbi:hypothetical protein C4K02_2640 [Pseudomonas synxantha]|nr:hypothetical protein C4K02_2640 [Pseudomonas synxantha]